MMSILTGITWWLTLSDKNRSTKLCLVAFIAFIASCNKA